MWNPCNKFKRRSARIKASRCRAQLTNLAPQDNAFDCSKPQSIKSDKNQKAPSLYSADSYYQYLDRALSDPHIFNIALAGHFGSGKSTILRTFEKHYARKRRFLNISLATFGTDIPIPETESNDTDSEDGKEEFDNDGNDNQSTGSEHSFKQNDKGEKASQHTETRRQHHLIEHSILQQLFYQVPKSCIPRSRFKRISKPGQFWPWVLFIFWLCSVGATITLFRPEAFVNAPSMHSIITAKTVLADILFITGALFAFALPAIVVFRKLRTVTLRKLNMKNCEIEISEEKDPSALNKHLDEILYFFEATDFDVVVLEDLDRFQTTDVFTKLREINTLVNRNIEAHNRRPWGRFLLATRLRKRRRVVFIYAIKDDMFTGEERTKFFDLVIPVIPVVNHTNSRELLTQALRARDFNDIDDELINDISIFVRDMRLLHNVVNEYTVYRRRLNMIGLEPEKLFAMIMYKNVCPEDFAKLHDDDGELHACIGSKPILAEKATNELRTKQQSLRKRLDEVHAEQLKSVEELRKLYILELQQQWLNQHSQLQPLKLDGKRYDWHQLTEDAPFGHLRSSDGSIRGHGWSLSVTFAEIEESVDPERSYAQREELILSRTGKKREQLDDKLAKLEDQIRELRHAKLAKLLKIIGSDALPSKAPPVVKMLLRKGYIDGTTYLSYLSYFYEGSLSNSDWIFVQGVKQGKSFDPDYLLTNVQEVVERNLGPEERISQACKNIHLLHYMARERGSDFAKVVDRLKRDPDEAVDLVMLHLNEDTHSPKYIMQLIHRHWPVFCQAVIDSHELSTRDWTLYMRSIILNLSEKNLESVLDHTQLRQAVSYDQRFVPLLLNLGKADRAKAFLDTVRPQFLELPEMDPRLDVARRIYEQGFYTISRHNVTLMHRLFVGELPDKLPPTITSLRDRDECKLAQHVDDNLDIYINILLETDDSIHREIEPVVVSLLNDTRLDRKTVENLIAEGCVPVEQLVSIESRESWVNLLSNQAVQPTWSNILAYHEECAQGELDDVLTDYLSDETVAAHLSKRCKAELFADIEGPGMMLMTQILACEGIPTSCVAKLLRVLPKDASFDDASAIASAHLAVAHPWIEFSVVNYEHIRTHAANCLGGYVKANLETFYAILAELNISGKDLAHIINVHPRKNRKREIVTVVCEHGLPDGLATVAGDICDLMIDDAEFAEVFDPEALATIISSTRDRATKIHTLTRFMDKLSNEGVWQVIRTAGDPYEDIAIKGKRPLLGKGEMNSNLASSLEKRGLISQAKEKKNGVRIITFSGSN